jgi:ubiquinone/menaquinone biosynthesis C-methylase UbiE
LRDSAQRFTSRVDTYAKYRPGYPGEVVDLLKSECGLTSDSIIADVGSGTGILSEVLLKNGNEVLGVEPNSAMRAAGELLLKKYSRFRSIAGSAEATTLESSSIDLITVGQAFHWFDGPQARAEFVRVLKPQGFAVLIWNERRLDSTPFLRSYEELLLNYGTDYEQVSHLNAREEIARFFAPRAFELRSFPNVQHFDFESLRGRVMSASYTPEPGHPNFEPMIVRLREIFDSHRNNGAVTFEYDTKVYFGRLAAR